MVCPPHPYSEVKLILLKCDALTAALSSKNYPRAFHEIQNDIFKLWFYRFLIYQVKVDLIVCRDIKSIIARYEENFTAHLRNHMVPIPLIGIRVDLEEKN